MIKVNFKIIEIAERVIKITNESSVNNKYKDMMDNFEFGRINEECKSRLENKKEEDHEPDENNKRKKNREDTLYRTKFGAKEKIKNKNSTAKKYREGTGNKRNLVGEKLYEEFSTNFWQKTESPFEQVHNENARKSNRASSSSHSSISRPEIVSRKGSKSSSEKSSDIAQLFENSSPVPRPVTFIFPKRECDKCHYQLWR
ncbi:hypothetical protein RclHR1_09830003 [Rhizophagus clarus]|uniref:Uncharacterized protein n=1 Tax=Rhizophagus clarus TaxID=94130 RepID=A0A2Z6S5P2_9GLOM|nr:hypothetical protein RclHR1_09830003 [Rhizophagus clarus]